MTDVNRRALTGMIRMVIVLPALVFLPAWTVHYWQAWVCFLVYFASVTAITVFLMKTNPELLDRRMKAGVGAEKEKSQKVIQSFAAVAFVALFVVSALDHRFGWSAVPTYAVIAGDMLILLSFAFVFRVFQVNAFTSGVIEVVPGQKVVTTGPYALIRHPMYAGALVMLCGIPMALGSWWGLCTMLPMTFVICWRLLDEEKFLAGNLAGYAEYRDRVKYRLAPLIW
jgi:protein-S-isoprenylcysteine O-methyltransferase Ste14